MTTIIQHNATELLNYLLSLFSRINSSQFLKNQIKMIIYLYLTDTPEASTNPLFYNNSTVKTNLIRYSQYLDAQYNYFQYSINGNRDYLTITVEAVPTQPAPAAAPDLYTTLKTSLLQQKEKKEKKEKRRTPVILSHHRADYTYYNQNKDFVKEFMKPFTGFTALVSIKIFDMMVKVDTFEQEREKYINQAKKINLADTLFHISVIQSSISKNQLTTNPTKESVKQQQELLAELTGYLNTYTNELNKCSDVFRHISSCLEDKKELGYKWQKQYCQRTVLLNVNKMVLTLNEDIINYIKSFIEPEFLENVRRSCITDRYFPFARQRVNDLLNNMSVQQLHLLCKNNLWMLYDLNEFKHDTSLNEINDIVLFINYYHNHNSHMIFDTDVLSINKKKKIIREIMETVTSSGLVNYYGFQRELYFVNKRILACRRSGK
jgi:hypothetical protein